MEEVIRLTSENPLTLLVKFGLMGRWNMTCAENCSGHGECHNGTCVCEIQFDGDECHSPNISYYVAFATVFFLLALVCLVQLVMCVVSEYQRMKAPSFLRACRVTTQKLLYFLVFLAAAIRGAYFTSPAAFQEGWSSSLMSAYYPLLLSGSSLVVCFWAEVFHLRDIRWEKPQFLSKSFLAFIIFNIITYSLLLAEFILTHFSYKSAEEKNFYTHVFNGCYAGLLFIVVIFFLIYGVEVFFKVRGGFLNESPVTNIAAGSRTPAAERVAESAATASLFAPEGPAPAGRPLPEQKIDVSQLHQSRLGLLSQALMLMMIVGFLFSETLSEFWKKKVPLHSRNWHDIVFRVAEIGVALWFPCVLWNCMSPEQLWILNPKRILKKLDLDSTVPSSLDGKSDPTSEKVPRIDDDDTSSSKDCWICYDSERQDMGPLIEPCQCRGDVSNVHHDCLRRWLVESASNPDSLRCKVCDTAYRVERGDRLDWQHGFTAQHWLQTAAIATCMCVSAAGAWVTIQVFDDVVIRCLAAGSALLIQFLGLHTVVAYQRAKVSAVSILGGHVSTISETVAVDIPKGTQQTHI
ncbi:uncharacterized protein LOC134539731 isoform X2 [Bacillus rossius redtenbacheri]|uniref:uncharacterized protein LOC134539731 isoform X2 n=1 Tax=Bacillus rossius redtenbacheri TaxID=93214 RepID=UPI002FDDF7B5